MKRKPKPAKKKQPAKKQPKRRCERWVPTNGEPTRTVRQERQGTGTLSMPPLMQPPPRIDAPPSVRAGWAPSAPAAHYPFPPTTRRSGYVDDVDAQGPSTRRSGYNRARARSLRTPFGARGRATNRATKISGKPTEAMTPSQINNELESLNKRRHKNTLAFIEAGRGSERPSDYQRLTDPLSLEALALADRLGSLHNEIRLRTGERMSTMPKGFGPRTNYAVGQTRVYGTTPPKGDIGKPVLYKGISIQKVEQTQLGYTTPTSRGLHGRGRKIKGYVLHIDGRDKFTDTLAEAKSYIDNY